MARFTPVALLTAAFLVVAVPAPAGAGTEADAVIHRCLETVRRSKDPVERFAAVRDLAQVDDPKVPVRLAALVREDADPGLRLEAAHALETTPDPGAEQQLLDLARAGGVREIREAVARALLARRVGVRRIVAEIDSSTADDTGRPRLVDVLASHPDILAAAHLERLARTWKGATREAALRGLECHPHGAALVADLVADLVGTSKDVDTLADALDVAGRVGDARIEAAETRLRALRSPVVDAAWENAAAHIAERRASKAGGTPSRTARVRDLVDRVYVFHQGRDVGRVFSAVRRDLAMSNPAWEDLRVSCEGYTEATALKRERKRNHLPFTRDPAKVKAYFLDMLYQTKRGNGDGLTEAIQTAFDASSWRWDADRRVVVYADAAPRAPLRAAIPPSVHRVMDATGLSVYFFGTKASDVPDALRRVAEAGDTTVRVVPPAGIEGTPSPDQAADTDDLSRRKR